jgi:PAS domain S-box-containing protein
MFGFDSPEQMIAERTDIERQHYVDPRRRMEKKRVLEERGVVLDFVAEAYRRDGSTLWTTSNTRAVRDAEGTVCYYEGFLQDITGRVRADEWEEKQKRLTALRTDVVAALAQGGMSLCAMLQQSAEAVVRHLDAALARIWTLNQAGAVLELQASAGIPMDLDDAYARIPLGHLKVGLIAKERAPHLTNTLEGDARIADMDWVRREGLVSFAGCPLVVDGRVVGVIAMFARRPLQQDTLDALSFIADTVAQGVERVRAETALRESEQQFRRLIEEAHVGILLVGPGGEVFRSNMAACRMLGLTEDQLDGKTPFDSHWDIINDDGTPFPAEAHPIPRAIASRSPVRNVVMGVYRPTTQGRVWLLVDAEPYLEDDGSVTHVVCTFSDITERKRTEEFLRQSEERNRAILKAVPDLIFLQTGDGVFLDYHAQDMSELLAPPESFLGKNMRDVLPPWLAEEFASCFERALRTGVTQVCEYTLPVEAQQRHYEARIVCCDGDKVLTVVRNVTAHRLAEAQRTQLLGRVVNAQEEERARLAKEVHDEFAAYLSVLKWGLESLERAGGLPARARSELAYLAGLTTQLQHKVRDFAFELSPAELDVKDGLPAALDGYIRRWAEHSGGRLEAEFCRADFQASGRLPREVEIALYRVTQEALTNVLKHAEARRVTVTLGFHALDEGREEVRLRIEDDGVGFAPAHCEGSERGLGLKGIGERMALLGGTLEVRPGKKGTTLLVRVPVSDTHQGGRNGGAANSHR